MRVSFEFFFGILNPSRNFLLYFFTAQEKPREALVVQLKKKRWKVIQQYRSLIQQWYNSNCDLSHNIAVIITWNIYLENLGEYHAMWGPRSIAKLVHITPITMVYGTQITIVTGANLNQLTSLGGPHGGEYHHYWKISCPCGIIPTWYLA